MSNITRVKINVKSGEIEIEGSETFVEKKLAELKDLLDLVCSSLPSFAVDTADFRATEESVEEAVKIPAKKDIQVPENFGEWYHKFPGKLQQTDQVLIAGYFVQDKSAGSNFKTSQANKTLKDQGIKVSNAAASLKQLQDAKRVFVVKKEGKLALFRVSDNGRKYLSKLLLHK